MTGMVMLTRGAGCGGGGGGGNGGTKGGASEEEQNQLSLVVLLIAALKKSMVACRVDQRDDQNSGGIALNQMEIGWPTNIQHLTHVTFDRFHGFLGLPVEFEVEIPCRVPSARDVGRLREEVFAGKEEEEVAGDGGGGGGAGKVWKNGWSMGLVNGC